MGNAADRENFPPVIEAGSETNFLPVIEAEVGYLTCPQHNRRLSSTPDAMVFSTGNRLGWEKWEIVSANSNANGTTRIEFFLKSHVHKKYLRASPEGYVDTSDNQGDWERWYFRPSSHYGGGVFFTSAVHEVEAPMVLACDNNGHLHAIEHSDPGESETWRFEALSGELLFVSSRANDRRLHCDSLGIIALRGSRKGWEVFRFVETGDWSRNVFIESWTHRGKFLSSDCNGKVFSTGNTGLSERWSVKKRQNDKGEMGWEMGLTIKSVEHGRYLATDGNSCCKWVCTTENFTGDVKQIWELEPGHYIKASDGNSGMKYFISSVAHDKRLSCSDKGRVFSSENRLGWEKWKVRVYTPDPGTVYAIFQSVKHGKFLKADQDGCLDTSDNQGTSEKWTLRPSPFQDHRSRGFSVFLESVAHPGRKLACDANGDVCIAGQEGERETWVRGRKLACNEKGDVYTVDDREGERETWVLEPILPGTITGAQIAALTTAGVLGIGCVVAAPFVATAAIGAIGFTGGGIASASIAAGMMSAEALASGGGVAAGGIVATLQSVGAAGLGAGGIAASSGVVGALVGGTIALSGMHACKNGAQGSCAGGAAAAQDRPFCEWRNWT